MADVETLPDTATAADDALLHGEAETPETESTDAAPAAQPEVSPTGQPRDDTGRFASKPPTATETAPVPATAPALGSEPSATPEIAPEPFHYQADGQAVEIPGATVDADYIHIPKTEAPRIQRLLAEGHAWQNSAQRYFSEVDRRTKGLESQVSQSREALQAAEAERTHAFAFFEKLVEDSKDAPPEKLFETPMGQFLLNLRNEWGVLKADARAMRVELEGKAARTRLAEIEAREQQATLRPHMEKTLSDHVLYFGQQVQLDRPTMEAIYADLMSPEYEGVTWIKAPQDDPLNSIKKGETVLNLALVQREIQRATKILSGRAPLATPAPKTVSAPVKRPVPPTVSATRGPAPKKGGVLMPRTRAEADAWLRDGAPDDE